MKKFNKILDVNISKTKVVFNLDDKWKFRISILTNDIIDFSLYYEKYVEAKNYIIDRKKLRYQKFKLSKKINKKYNIYTERIKIIIEEDPFRLKVLKKINNYWREICSDRETGAWYWNEDDNCTSHYQHRKNDHKFYGLGERSGNLEKSHRRFVFSQKDALGYNAEKSDPLYKSFPWLYVVNTKIRDSDFGLLYDNLNYGSVDLGGEHSNYHLPYRYINFKNRGIQGYLILKNKKNSILSSLNNLIGPRYLPPKWSLGFQFSSMEIADDKNSQKLYLEFLKKCSDYKIPISSLHFGSGYTLHGKKRYMFVWNKKKFPNPKSFLFKIKKKGIHLTANIKPALLTTHPFYKAAVKENIFICDEDDNPIIIQFWDETASLIDFTKKEAVDWWKNKVTKYILSNGFDTIWNDNNEYDLEEKNAFSFFEKSKVKTSTLIPLQALLMTKASAEAMAKYYPNIRNHGVTRSGGLGIQKYAETWTGDNDTSWHSLKWSSSIGLGLSLSGIGLFGHDIGGFTGPKTSKDLMIRSLQLMLFHPRFHMNSWKPNAKKNSLKKKIDNLNNTNLPWLYLDSISLVSDLIKLRYQLLPIIYAALWRYFKEGEPIIRPLFLDFPEKEHFTQEEVFSINERIIVAPVLHQHKKTINIFLPYCDEGWFDYFSFEFISTGGWVTIEAPINKIPIIIRGGTLIPKLKVVFNQPHLASIAEIILFPSKSNISFSQKNLPLIFDDGETKDYEKNKNLVLTPHIKIEKNNLLLLFNKIGKGKMQKEKIIIKYPNDKKLIIKNCSNYFIKETYNYILE